MPVGSAFVMVVFIHLFVDADLIQSSKAEVEYHRFLIELLKLESSESAHYQRIVDSLIKFVKFYKLEGLELDFTVDQVIELVLIFERVIKLKIALLKSLTRKWVPRKSVIRDEKVQALAQKDELHASRQLKVYRSQMVCLKEFSSCVNLEVIAKRLSSSKLEMIVDAIEYLLPYAKIYSEELDVCIKGSLLNITSFGKSTVSEKKEPAKWKIFREPGKNS
ncbi:uncharacterized protein LOC116347473 [Contarinia nasturtii]|uniref:uncharacterized protein LOC116347473 n=1 Tax=Contarinia nasturtii TaxID=265458 RepID=UPI0012D38716|nr:uncharacterized protein LOC116347473 [Contarinia nasturtii]XP_031633922.1 uncharacterized protein LOC116347473 [Contarinia nasturtii]